MLLKHYDSMNYHKTLLFIMITIIMLSLPVSAVPSTPHGLTRADGDSFLLAVSGPNPQYDYTFIERFSDYYDLDLNNTGVGGTNTSYTLTLLYKDIVVPTPYDTHVINAGYSDIKRRWSEDGITNATAHRIGSMVAYLRLDNIRKPVNSLHLYSGSWTRTIANYTDSFSLVVNTSHAAGDTMTTTVDGDIVSIGILNYPGESPMINITVDNTVTYSYGVTNYGTNQCPLANTYCASAIEIPMDTDGTHDVVVENANGETFAIDWVGSGHKDTAPVIVINGITKTPNYPDGCDEKVDEANVLIQRELSMFDDKVIYCSQDSFDAESYPYIGPVGHDITHPNNFGHMVMFQNMRISI